MMRVYVKLNSLCRCRVLRFAKKAFIVTCGAPTMILVEALLLISQRIARIVRSLEP